MIFMDKIISLDYFLTNLFNKSIPHNIFFDYFFSFFSMKGGSILIWMAIIVLLIIFEEKINKKFILKYFLVALVITSIVVFGLKNTVKRARPTTVCEKDFSFPSGHAATAFAAATVLTFFDKKRRWFYYLVAVLIGYSRIYLGCHYFLDVITGALVGYIISQTLLFVPGTFPFRRKSW